MLHIRNTLQSFQNISELFFVCNSSYNISSRIWFLLFSTVGYVVALQLQRPHGSLSVIVPLFNVRSCGGTLRYKHQNANYENVTAGELVYGSTNTYLLSQWVNH